MLAAAAVAASAACGAVATLASAADGAAPSVAGLRRRHVAGLLAGAPDPDFFAGSRVLAAGAAAALAAAVDICGRVWYCPYWERQDAPWEASRWDAQLAFHRFPDAELRRRGHDWGEDCKYRPLRVRQPRSP